MSTVKNSEYMTGLKRYIPEKMKGKTPALFIDNPTGGMNTVLLRDIPLVSDWMMVDSADTPESPTGVHLV